MSYIEVSHSYKRYKMGETEIVANRDVSFSIEKGELAIILGSSGAGKSTMLKILAGLQQPTEGNVAVQRGVTIGYLPQVMILSDTRTVMAEPKWHSNIYSSYRISWQK